MNPVDHPHGGGEGRTSGGRHPVVLGACPQGRELVITNERIALLSVVAAVGRDFRMTFSQEGPFVDDHLWRKIEKMNEAGDRKVPRLGLVSRPSFQVCWTHVRSAQWQELYPSFVTENMVGQSCEFSPTRTYRGHADKKAKR